MKIAVALLGVALCVGATKAQAQTNCRTDIGGRLECREDAGAQPERANRGDASAFDEGCVAAALQCLAAGAIKSMLYVPVAYDNLLRPSLLAACVERFARLPGDCRAHLGAAIYGVPRDPGFGAMTHIHETLGPHFQTIDLRVDDPAFEIEKLSVHAVAGVSFALPAGDRRSRIAALRHFASRRSHYKQRRIWASVTNIRDGEELAACVSLGVPFMSGPGVCKPQLLPLGGRLVPRGRLPVGYAPFAEAAA